MLTYKKISPEDLPLIKDLLRVFGGAFNEVENYTADIPSDEYLKKLLSRDTFITIVAMEGGKVIGGVCAYVLEKFEKERKEIYIYDLAVEKDYRRRGIATGLINKLKEIGKDIGAYVIYVQADKKPQDWPALKLYEKLGKIEDVYHFDIDVE